MSKRSDYIAEYADAAKEQMKRYGIPASVILAQGIIESGNGGSELSRLGNNHFGIKATQSWIDSGGQYLVYTDDKPDEKFCSYPTVADSYEHHSKFLVENSRYASLFKLSPDDYRGWSQGLWEAGYASKKADVNGKTYADKLNAIIEANGLDKYDKEVMKEMRGKEFGLHSSQHSAQPAMTDVKGGQHYSFPLASKEFLLVTSPFGMRTDPMDHSKQQMHKGIDLRCDHAPLFATEDGGKVISVNNNVNTGGGRSVTVEYDREDGNKIQVSYMHLDTINVKVGDTLKAGQELGISGNTGTRTTGPHLHLSVKQVDSDGEKRDIDPVSYLADIAVKGGIQQQVMYNGENLLNKYVTEQQRTEVLGQDVEPVSVNPEEWMRKLLSSEDAGHSVSADPLMDMIVSIFSTLMALALQIDNRSQEDKMQTVTESALNRKIDLTGLVAGVKECSISWEEDQKPALSMKVGDKTIVHALTDNETKSLAAILDDTGKSDAEKQQRIASMVGQIVARQQVSNNYEQSLGQGNTQGLQR